MSKGSAGKAIHRKDYQPWSWVLESAELYFDLHEAYTSVRSRLLVLRNSNGSRDSGIDLDCKDLELISLRFD